MHRTQFEMVRSGLGTGVLVVALFFQMLPIFFLLMVMAHTLGVTGRGWLAVTPVLLLGMMFAACWLAAKRSPARLPKNPHRARYWRPSWKRRSAQKRLRDPVVLMKTRAEHYQELKDILGRAWR